MTLITDNLTVLVSPSGDNVETQQLASQDKHGIFKECSRCLKIKSVKLFKCDTSLCYNCFYSLKPKIIPDFKTCHCCGINKDKSCFFNKIKSKDGLDTECRECRSLKGKKYFENPEVKLRHKNHQKLPAQKEKTRQRNKRKYHSNKHLRLKIILISRVRLALKAVGGKRDEPIEELLGISIEKFWEYLESLFLPGMSRDNHAILGWHIDHIVPCDYFDLTKEKEKLKCFHYTNMMPRWATTAIAKAHNSDQIGNTNKRNLILPKDQLVLI